LQPGVPLAVLPPAPVLPPAAELPACELPTVAPPPVLADTCFPLSDGEEWAGFKGFNLRLANGNTLVNYGPGGVICEITPDKKRAFQVKFDVATGDDHYNKMVGNTVLVADLYALNGGGPK
jgi:hypothetical protein